MRNTKILAGSSHPELAALVTKRLGTPLSECTLKKFSNKETNVEIRKFYFILVLIPLLNLSRYI